MKNFFKSKNKPEAMTKAKMAKIKPPKDVTKLEGLDYQQE